MNTNLSHNALEQQEKIALDKRWPRPKKAKLFNCSPGVLRRVICRHTVAAAFQIWLDRPSPQSNVVSACQPAQTSSEHWEELQSDSQPTSTTSDNTGKDAQHKKEAVKRLILKPSSNWTDIWQSSQVIF